VSLGRCGQFSLLGGFSVEGLCVQVEGVRWSRGSFLMRRVPVCGLGSKKCSSCL
jgi:hypothetical protein